MKKLPEIMPEYTIEKIDKEPFSVKREELTGWFIIPKLGETLSWATYDFPARKRTESYEIQVMGKAEIHGIEGVEILAVDQNKNERYFVAQLTDSHCRLLAESHTENGVKKYHTFLDGDEFLSDWGFGEDNCGTEVNILPKGHIIRESNQLSVKESAFPLDVAGRYIVTIGGKNYDTICVVNCYNYSDGVLSEQFIDKNGRTVLWRRFNRNDWAFNHYQKNWSELLPLNQQLSVNGVKYVHWYDCISDYIL